MTMFGWINSLKAKFAIAKVEHTTRGHRSRRVYVRHGVHGQIVGSVREHPSKQHPCICGSGRKYGKCCKRAFAQMRADKAAGKPLEPIVARANVLQGLLQAWRIRQARTRAHLD